MSLDGRSGGFSQKTHLDKSGTAQNRRANKSVAPGASLYFGNQTAAPLSRKNATLIKQRMYTKTTTPRDSAWKTFDVTNFNSHFI